MSSGIFCFFSTFLIYRKCFIKSKKQAHRRVPVNFVLNCRLLVSEKMNRRFSFLNNPQIIIIGAHFSCLLQINPNITVNFLLLNFDIICKCLCKEKDNPFANFTERTVFADTRCHCRSTRSNRHTRCASMHSNICRCCSLQAEFSCSVCFCRR